MAEPVITVDLDRFRSPGIGIFMGRDHGKAVREHCGIVEGSRVKLIVPDDVYALGAGFPDELLYKTVIVGITCKAESIFETLIRRRVPFSYDPPAWGPLYDGDTREPIASVPPEGDATETANA